MLKPKLIILISLLFVAVKLSAFFKYNIRFGQKLDPIRLPRIIPFDSVENLKENNLLTKATYIGHGKLQGPETIVFSQNGTMYTGLINGQIVRVDTISNTVHKIAQFGYQTNENICNDYGKDLHSKQECGRPLGLRIKPGTDLLYAADSYHGIYQVNLTDSEVSLILSAHDSRFKDRPLKLLNDLDLDETSGIIYFIDSSYEKEFNDVVDEHIECLPRGRLFSFDQENNRLEMLSDGLYLPNGIQLMPDKQSLLINENSMARIVRYFLKGNKKGQTEIFIENMPGFGDTIRLTDHNTLLVPFVIARNALHSSVIDMIGEYPFIRSLITAMLNTRRISLSSPKYGLLAEYDLNGNLIKSWHDSAGKKVECITNAVVHDGKIYMGSFYNDFIAVLEYD